MHRTAACAGCSQAHPPGHIRHIHLHPLGRVAGNMFAACLLDAVPEHRPAAIEAAQSLAPIDCRPVRHNDGRLAGSRFVVDDPGHGHHPGHSHTDWRDIRTRLTTSTLA